MKMRGSVVTLSFVLFFPYPPEDKKKNTKNTKKARKKNDAPIIFGGLRSPVVPILSTSKYTYTHRKLLPKTRATL